jgi:hypothetical protein
MSSYSRKGNRMTAREILAIAHKHDPGAVWASNDADENCLLVMPSAVVFLLDRAPDAYEDPNPPGSLAKHTRVVFPTLDADTEA